MCAFYREVSVVYEATSIINKQFVLLKRSLIAKQFHASLCSSRSISGMLFYNLIFFMQHEKHNTLLMQKKFCIQEKNWKIWYSLGLLLWRIFFLNWIFMRWLWKRAFNKLNNIVLGMSDVIVGPARLKVC